MEINHINMTFDTSGPLLREDLETRAKNFLKFEITNKESSLHLFSADEEIKFLLNKEYIAPKEGPGLKYAITSKGREYVSNQPPLP